MASENLPLRVDPELRRQLEAARATLEPDHEGRAASLSSVVRQLLRIALDSLDIAPVPAPVALTHAQRADLSDLACNARVLRRQIQGTRKRDLRAAYQEQLDAIEREIAALTTPKEP